MFGDIGLSELLVIAAVVLLVTKPEDVPVIMHKLGVFMAHARAFVAGMWAGVWESAYDRLHIEKGD